MKKLMIAAAIVCSAVLANAAALDWKWSSTLYDHPNGDKAYVGTVYIVNYNSYTQQQVLDAVLGGNDLANYAMSSYTTANGKTGANNVVIAEDSATFAPVRDDGGDNYADYFYAALVKDGDGTDYIFLSTKGSKVISPTSDTSLASSLSASKVSFESDTFSVQGWYNASAVPEPTSGLLLLLGVAGLALRRRRA